MKVKGAVHDGQPLRLSKKPCRKFKNKKLHKDGKAPSERGLRRKTVGESA